MNLNRFTFVTGDFCGVSIGTENRIKVTNVLLQKKCEILARDFCALFILLFAAVHFLLHVEYKINSYPVTDIAETQ